MKTAQRGNQGERWAECLLHMGIGHPWSRVSPSSPWAGLVNHKEPPSHNPNYFTGIIQFQLSQCFPLFPGNAPAASQHFLKLLGSRAAFSLYRIHNAYVSWGNSWLVWWDTGTKQAIITTFRINIKMIFSNLHESTVYQSGEWNTDCILSFVSRVFLDQHSPHTYILVQFGRCFALHY